MDVLEIFGPRLSAMIIAIAAIYFTISFGPVWWPAFVAFRLRPYFPRPVLFVGTVAALVYGVLSFLAFAVLLPIQGYSIFIAPALVERGIAEGAWLLRISGLFVSYWWLVVPSVQFVMTCFITRRLGRRWTHICAAPPDDSSKPDPLRGLA